MRPNTLLPNDPNVWAGDALLAQERVIRDRLTFAERRLDALEESRMLARLAHVGAVALLVLTLGLVVLVRRRR